MAAIALAKPEDDLKGAEGSKNATILFVCPRVVELRVTFVLERSNVKDAVCAERVETHAKCKNETAEIAASTATVNERANETRVEPEGTKRQEHKVECHHDEYSAVEVECDRPLRA